VLVANVKAVIQVVERRPLKKSAIPDLIEHEIRAPKGGARSYLKAMQWGVLVLMNNAGSTIEY